MWPLLLLFVPGLILAARSPEMRIVFFAFVLMMLGLTLQIWPAHGHYAAPAAGAVLLILLQALRQLRSNPALNWKWFNPAWFSRAIVFAVFLWMLVPISDRLWNPYGFENYRVSDRTSVPKEIDRARIEAQLSRMPGQHLVIVHYSRRDVPSVEWVYNRADIDNSKVVWARDMGPAENQELLRYYANRRVWYVDRSSGSMLTPYSNSIASNDLAKTLLTNAR